MTDEEVMNSLKPYFDIIHFFGKASIENELVSFTGSLSIRQDIKVTTLPVKFKTVDGNFDCGGNNLTTLAGAPQSVSGFFSCSRNQLTSLVGAPQSVGLGFWCDDNKLTSLIGAPRSVNSSFDCRMNPLSSLTGAPQYIKGTFFLTYSKNLPLLPLLKIKGCKEIRFSIDKAFALKDLSAILNRYLSTGTRGMLPCAMEMIRAGYGSNAKL